MPRITTKKFLAGAFVVALLGGGALMFQHGSLGNAAAQGAAGEMPAMPVPVLSIEERPVQLWKDFSGRLVAVDYVEIRPQVSGIIEKVNFEDGQIVNQGDILFNIDPRPYEAEVAAARATMAAAQQNENYTQKELKRAEELLKTGAISQAGYDERVNSQKNNKSAIAGANAVLKAALVNLDNASIKAPVSGRISRPEITEGNLVTSSAAPLLTTIVSDKEIYADFEVDEQTYLNFVRAKAGQSVESEKSIPVEMSLNSDEKKYTGTIKSFDNKINPSTGTIRARAIFSNEDNALLPGMFAKLRIGSTGKENMITVLEKAILTDQSRKFVYVVTDGAATYREVKLGDSVGIDRIVLSGLNPGDKVIIDNLMKIRPGAKVQGMSPQEIEAMKNQAAQQAQPKAEAKEEPAKAEETPAPEENTAVQPEPAKE